LHSTQVEDGVCPADIQRKMTAGCAPVSPRGGEQAMTLSTPAARAVVAVMMAEAMCA
jgi:hypothetical protein